MRQFKATKEKVHNRGSAPDEFLNKVIDVVKSMPDSAFEVNAESDIFTSVKPQLGPWPDLIYRRGVICEVARISGGFESSWNWVEGRDLSASNTGAFTEEAGIFQASANSMYFGQDLKDLFKKHTGMSYGSSNAVGKKFISQTKIDKDYAVEHFARLIRYNGGVRHFGPIARKEINKWLSRGAVSEFVKFLRDVDAPTIEGIPPRPRNYDEVYRIFGNPREAGWSANNLEFCKVPNSLTAFPLIASKSARGFYCHKLLVGQFQKCFEEVANAGLKVYSWEGCYNLRNIAGSSTLSLHSWGIACDFNYEGNTYGDSTPAMDKKIVAIFKKHGFFWGGDFRGKKDGMHFEWMDRS